MNTRVVRWVLAGLLSVSVVALVLGQSRHGFEGGVSRRTAATIAAGLDPVLVVLVDGGQIVGTTKDWFPAFSSDGSRVAYIAAKGVEHFVVTDGPPLAVGGMVRPRLVFCDDRVAYAVGTAGAGPTSARWLLRFGAYSTPTVALVSEIACSPDGKQLAYIASDGGATVLGVGNHRGGAHDAVQGPIVFGPGGDRIAAAAMRDGRWFVLLGDRTSTAPGTPGEPAFLPAATHTALGDGAAFKWALVAVKEQLETPVEAVGPIALSRDRLVYAIKLSGSWRVTGSDVPQDSYDAITAVAISPDGQRVAYGAVKERQHFVVVDGMRGAPYAAIDSLAFSPDSRRVAYAAKREKNWSCIVDGKAGRESDAVHSVVFSPDSAATAYVATAGDKRFVISGDVEGPRVDSITGLTFAADGASVSFGARDGRRLEWVTLRVR